MQDASNPWVWDEKHRRYRFFDVRKNEWIWQEGGGVEATGQSTESRPKKSRSKRDSGRPSGEHFQDPEEPYPNVRRLNLDEEDEEPNPFSLGGSTPRASYNDSTPSQRRAQGGDVLAGCDDDDEDNDQDDYNDGGGDDDHDDVGAAGGGDGGSLWDLHRQEPVEVNKKFFKIYHERIFVPGFVFQCVFNQEMGISDADDKTKATGWAEVVNSHGQRIHTEIRIFVVLRGNGDHSSTCLSVQTYKQKGVAKPGLRKSNFAVFFSKWPVPTLLSGEVPEYGEKGMRDAIYMKPINDWDGLNPMSRIHLRATHCCQHNWKIYPFGHVPDDWMRKLEAGHQAALKDSDGGKPWPRPRTVDSKQRKRRKPPNSGRRGSSHQNISFA